MMLIDIIIMITLHAKTLDFFIILNCLLSIVNNTNL